MPWRALPPRRQRARVVGWSWGRESLLGGERDRDPPERIAREVVAGEHGVRRARRDRRRDALVGERGGGGADDGLRDVERLDHLALSVEREAHARGGAGQLDL